MRVHITIYVLHYYVCSVALWPQVLLIFFLTSDPQKSNNVRYLVRRGDANNASDNEQIDQIEIQHHWNFPPTLDEFNLMDSEVDPAELEAMFTDSR